MDVAFLAALAIQILEMELDLHDNQGAQFWNLKDDFLAALEIRTF